MSEECIVCGKSVLKSAIPKMSLHAFPVCPKQRQIWLKRCGLTDKEVLPNHKICSFHFEPTCFTPSKRRRLLYRDAEPTIFKKGHAKVTNMPLKIVKVITGKSSKMSEKCIVCEKSVLKSSIPKMSLHAFPVCPKQRQIWLKRCGLTDIEVLPNHKICSFHFEPTCFRSNPIRRVLYRDAEPTIFKKGHAKVTNMPLKIVKGKPTNWNKNVIAIQNRQSCDISPTKTVNKEISGQNRESNDIPSTKYTKKVLAGKSSQSRNISPMEVVKTMVYAPYESCYVALTRVTNEEISGQNRESCDIPLTRNAKKVVVGQNNQSCDISLTKTGKKVIASPNHRAHDISPTKAQKRISGQNHKSYDILPTKIAKKVIASQSSQSQDVSLTKAGKKVITSQNRQAHDMSPSKVTKEVITDQNCEARDMSPTKETKEVTTGQNCQPLNISLTKVVQKEISSQNDTNNENLLTRAFVEEVFHHTVNILALQKKALENLDRKMLALKEQKSSLISQLEIATNKIAMLQRRSDSRSIPRTQ